jgi:hypothetical protein
MIARGDLPGAIKDYTTALELSDEVIANGDRIPDLWLIHLNRYVSTAVVTANAMLYKQYTSRALTVLHICL